MAQSIISNTVISFAGRALNVGLGIVATALMTRYLGPAKFGSYVLLLSFGTVIQLLADAGLYLTTTREISRQPARTNEILSQVLGLRAALLLVVFAASWLAVLAVPIFNELRDAYVLMALALSFQSLSQIFMGVFQRDGEMWRASAGDTAGRLVQVVLLAALGRELPTVKYMAMFFCVSAAAVWLTHQFLLPRRIKWRPAFNWQIWRQLAASSWPLGLMLLVNAVYFRADVVILSWFRPAVEVGWYGVAYRVVDSGLFFPAMFGGLLLPKISAARGAKNLDRVKLLIRDSLNFLALAAGLVLPVLMIKSRDIVHFISGESYLAAAPLLSWLSLALAAMFFGNLFGFVLVAFERQRDLLKLYLVLVAFNVGSNLVLIPRWGATAAAVTTLATELISMSVAAAIVFKVCACKPDLSYFLRTAMAGAAAAAALSFIPGSLGVSLAAGAAAYLIAAAALKIIHPRHMRTLWLAYDEI